MKTFDPPKFWSSSHLQTIASFLLPSAEDIEPDATHTIELSDGDRLLLMENRPERDYRDRIVLLVHGLSGCYQSNFMVRLNRRFVENGYTSFRLNLRGCGPGWNLARKPCNAGRSADLRATLRWLKEYAPNRPVTVVGFSLGANILLKMAGEDANQPSGMMDRLVAVSPPLDLERAVNYMCTRENRVYSRFFTWRLKKDIEKIQKLFPELREYDVSRCREVLDIDESYTAPLSGFKSARDYYSQSSCEQFLPRVKVPGLILGSFDDPIVDGSVYHRLEKHPHLDYKITETGGHVAFLAAPWRGQPLRWMDDFIVDHVTRSH